MPEPLPTRRARHPRRRRDGLRRAVGARGHARRVPRLARARRRRSTAAGRSTGPPSSPRSRTRPSSSTGGPRSSKWRPPGEMGLSTGPWTSHEPHGTPARAPRHGQFVSVWKRAPRRRRGASASTWASRIPGPHLADAPCRRARRRRTGRDRRHHRGARRRDFAGSRRSPATRPPMRPWRPPPSACIARGTRRSSAATAALASPAARDARTAWTVEAHETSASGDFGYAIGSVRPARAAPTAGHFVRVWRREADGWRIAARRRERPGVRREPARGVRRRCRREAGEACRARRAARASAAKSHPRSAAGGFLERRCRSHERRHEPGFRRRQAAPCARVAPRARRERRRLHRRDPACRRGPAGSPPRSPAPARPSAPGEPTGAAQAQAAAVRLRARARARRSRSRGASAAGERFVPGPLEPRDVGEPGHRRRMRIGREKRRECRAVAVEVARRRGARAPRSAAPPRRRTRRPRAAPRPERRHAARRGGWRAIASPVDGEPARARRRRRPRGAREPRAVPAQDGARRMPPAAGRALPRRHAAALRAARAPPEARIASAFAASASRTSSVGNVGVPFDERRHGPRRAIASSKSAQTSGKTRRAVRVDEAVGASRS